jgi:hypothetical protein
MAGRLFGLLLTLAVCAVGAYVTLVPYLSQVP